MRILSLRLLAGTILLGTLPPVANAATTHFGPSVYVQHGDTPADFLCPTCNDELHVEDFEDGVLDPFLTIDNGEIIDPTFMSGSAFTDSVDFDDMVLDGLGNDGHSWYTGSKASATITFANPVKSAGLVFTDGDSDSQHVTLEAFNSAGDSLGVIDGMDLADDVFTGETAEDRFMGFHSDERAIASITLSIDAGIGIELDHVHWQECVPEPTSFGLAMASLLGLIGLRRRRRC